MITITQEGYKLTVEGHAGYAPYGQDIVCAAVSTLFAALSEGLKRHEEYFSEPPSVVMRSGVGEFKCKPKPECMEAVSLVWGIFEDAFVVLSLQYPDYINFHKN